jgi:tripartite-type tricarboxylate transporter receptor subunit TctC
MTKKPSHASLSWMIPFGALAVLAAATPLGANAQAAYPSKPIKIIVPYPPGGAVDVVTRKMAQKLTEQMGQSIIVDNKPGGTGTIGASAAARAEADGYTLMANDTTYSLLPFIFKKLPFDHDKDLVPVSAYVFAPMAMVVNAESPYKTLAEFLAAAKAAPGKLTYGTGGAGTTPHFTAEAFGVASGTKLMHVPFKGAGEATQAVLSNTIDMQFSSTPGVMGNVKGGKLRLLAVSGDKRLVALPAVPTFAEAGVKNFSVVNWTGLWAPKGTPAPVLARLQQEIAKAMATPDMKAFAEGLGAEPRMADAAAFAKMLTDSNVLWGKIAANASFDKQ